MLLWQYTSDNHQERRPVAMFSKWDPGDEIFPSTRANNLDIYSSSLENTFSFTNTTANVFVASTERMLNATFDNVSLNDTLHEDHPLYLKIWASIIIVVLMVIGVSGNVLVPLLVCRTRELRHSTNIFLLNLAAADMLIMIVCLPTALVELHTLPNTWVLGATLCQLVPYIEVCVTRVSVVTLVVISVERWVAICQPLSSPVVCTKPRAALVCLAIWPIVTFSSIPTIILTVFDEDTSGGATVYNCYTAIANKSWGSTYHITCLTVFSFIPFVFLLLVYSMITHKLLCHPPSSNRRCDNQQRNARKQVVYMLGAVVVVFFISVLPFQFFTLWIILVPNEEYENLGENYQNIIYICRCLFYVNSAANPIIYNAMSSKFRSAFLRFFGITSSPKKLLRRQSTLTTTSSSLSNSSSLRRRASSILMHRPIEVFGRKGSFRYIFGKKQETNNPQDNSTESSQSNCVKAQSCKYPKLNDTSSKIEGTEDAINPLIRIPIIKEDFSESHNEKEELSHPFKINRVPPPSPLSLPSVSSHASTPPSSPIYSLVQQNGNRSPSLAPSESFKKVSFNETVFHWDNEYNNIDNPNNEKPRCHSNRKSTLKHSMTNQKRSSFSFADKMLSTEIEEINSAEINDVY